MPDPERLLLLAARLATEAGALLMERLPYTRDVTSKSTPTDLVSEVDHASEALVVGGIRAARPDDGILGEEGTDDDGTTGLRWVVDPLDGTINYLYRGAAFAVSIGVEDAAGPLAGAVFDPQRGELFTAVRGAGSRLNGEPLRCSDATDLSLALVGTGFGYAASRREEQARVVSYVLPRVRDIRRSGSATVDWCALAAGRIDAFYESGQAPWDYTAGALIAAEAGAVVTGPGGGRPSPELAVGAAPGIHAAFVALLDAATPAAAG